MEEAKRDLIKEFDEKISCMFNDEKVDVDGSLIRNISIENILKNIFNTEKFGKFEYIEGESGKEIILKMQTSDTPFALIRIGNTQQIITHYLLGKYERIKNYVEKKYFQNLNESEINILLGSRAFYEGWDSNRP